QDSFEEECFIFPDGEIDVVEHPIKFEPGEEQQDCSTGDGEEIAQGMCAMDGNDTQPLEEFLFSEIDVEGHSIKVEIDQDQPQFLAEEENSQSNGQAQVKCKENVEHSEIEMQPITLESRDECGSSKAALGRKDEF
ncbi:hypothetical protein B566_EDAN016170, partial [Ephemera danica]